MRFIKRHDVVRASFVLLIPLLAAINGCGGGDVFIGTDTGGGSPGAGGTGSTGEMGGNGGGAAGASSSSGGGAGASCTDENGQTTCDDGNPCTSDACDNAGNCTHALLSDGTSCDNFKVCQGGMCSEGCFIDGMFSTSCEAGAWPFSEGSGGTTADATGNGNNGTLSNTAWIAGHSGNGLQFFGSGSPSSVLIPNNAPLKFGTGNFTVVAWVTRLGGSSTGEAIAVGANRCGVQESWLLSLVGASSTYPGFATFGAGSTYGYLVSPTAITDTNWHQIAGRRSGTTVTLLVDGVVKATGTVASGYSSDAGGAGIMVGNLQDGIQDVSCPAGREFNGKIDSIYLFNRALTDAEIAALQ